MNPGFVIAASCLSGGLAGASVNIVSNRISRLRVLRTDFYPIIKNMTAAYMIRMDHPEGRYWTSRVGFEPADEDKDFIGHRASFQDDLVRFNELKEVRVLRTKLLDHMFSGDHERGKEFKHDLAPESVALNACWKIVHEKLKL